MTERARWLYVVALTLNTLGAALKAVWYLLATILGGLALAGLQHAAHSPDAPTLVGDIAITVSLLAGAWVCLTHANRLSEASRDNKQKHEPRA